MVLKGEKKEDVSGNNKLIYASDKLFLKPWLAFTLKIKAALKALKQARFVAMTANFQ